jgi:hypothetical protein
LKRSVKAGLIQARESPCGYGPKAIACGLRFIRGCRSHCDEGSHGLPAITVTGTAPPGDIVSRDRDQRSPDINWPTTLSIKWSEVFAHNGIVINASCATVWNHLVQAELWPQWCSFSGKVKIKDGSQILQKNTKFSWRGLDLPQDDKGVFQYTPEPLVSKVIEYVPERRIGWYSFGTFTDVFVLPTILGSLPQSVLKSAG